MGGYNDILFWGTPDWNITHTAVSTGETGCIQSSPAGIEYHCRSVAPSCPKKNEASQGTNLCQTCELLYPSHGPKSNLFSSDSCVSNQCIWESGNCTGEDYGKIYSFLRKE